MTEGRPGGLIALAVINFKVALWSCVSAGGVFACSAMLNSELVPTSQMTDEERAGVAIARNVFTDPLTKIRAVMEAVSTLLLIAAGIGYIQLRRVLGRWLGNIYAVWQLVPATLGVIVAVRYDADPGIGALIGFVYPILTLVLLNTVFRHDFVSRRSAGVAPSVAAPAPHARTDPLPIAPVQSSGARHLWLIGSHAAQNSLRGGAGIIFLLTMLLFGLFTAHLTITPIEMMQKTLAKTGAPVDANATATLVLDRVQGAVSWLLGADLASAISDAAEPGTERIPAGETPEQAAQRVKAESYRRWTTYLLEERPGLLSAIFLILMFGIPLLLPFVGFNQVSGDVQSRGLRYLLLRTERRNIFFGRFLGTAIFSILVIAFLVAVVTFYLGLRMRVYDPGALAIWAAYGFCALTLLVLPYIALTSLISASINSPFLSLTLNSLIIGGIPLAALLVSMQWKYGIYLKFATPWGIQNHLLHPDLMHSLGAAAGCVGYTVVYLLLGYRIFAARDL